MKKFWHRTKKEPEFVKGIICQCKWLYFIFSDGSVDGPYWEAEEHSKQRIQFTSVGNGKTWWDGSCAHRMTREHFENDYADCTRTVHL